MNLAGEPAGRASGDRMGDGQGLPVVARMFVSALRLESDAKDQYATAPAQPALGKNRLKPSWLRSI